MWGWTRASKSWRSEPDEFQLSLPTVFSSPCESRFGRLRPRITQNLSCISESNASNLRTGIDEKAEKNIEQRFVGAVCLPGRGEHGSVLVWFDAGEVWRGSEVKCGGRSGPSNSIARVGGVHSLVNGPIASPPRIVPRSLLPGRHRREGPDQAPDD
jgi:hypothetical protein